MRPSRCLRRGDECRHTAKSSEAIAVGVLLAASGPGAGERLQVGPPGKSRTRLVVLCTLPAAF